MLLPLIPTRVWQKKADLFASLIYMMSPRDLVEKQNKTITLSPQKPPHSETPRQLLSRTSKLEIDRQTYIQTYRQRQKVCNDSE